MTFLHPLWGVNQLILRILPRTYHQELYQYRHFLFLKAVQSLVYKYAYLITDPATCNSECRFKIVFFDNSHQSIEKLLFLWCDYDLGLRVTFFFCSFDHLLTKFNYSLTKNAFLLRIACTPYFECQMKIVSFRTCYKTTNMLWASSIALDLPDLLGVDKEMDIS